MAHELALFVFIDALGVELAERHRSARGLARAGRFSSERAAVDTLAVLRRAADDGRR